MKKTLLVPMAGYGKRFSAAGYSLPKQLLPIFDLTCLEYSLKSLIIDKHTKVIFIARQDYLEEYDINPIISKFCNKFDVIALENDTRGSLETCLKAQHLIDDDSELHIFTLDIHIFPEIVINEIDMHDSEGSIAIIKTNNPGFSYAKIDQHGNVVQTAEKKVISELGAAGLYSFKNAKVFFEYCKEVIDSNELTSNEFFIAPIYNKYIRDGRVIKVHDVNNLYMFGTPREYEWVNKYIVNNIIKIGIASDHSGYEEKLKLIKELKNKGFEVHDFGCYSNNPCDYPDYVRELCKSIINNQIDIGISLCKSGQGVNIAANKSKYIYSSLINANTNIELTIEHNNPNHFAIAAIDIDKIISNRFVDKLKNCKFSGGRHQDRLMKLSDYD
jgi:RpiB/LacA/LacB family sugar-phosphate isomerase